MGQPFIGQVIAVAFNFAPQGWVQCNGQLLPISGNDALFSLIGTTFGGDGVSTFGVPDLRGRAVVGMGTGAGLSNYVLGQLGGSPNVTLTTANMPAHTHAVMGATNGTSAIPANNAVLGAASDGSSLLYDAPNNPVTLNPSAVTTASGGAQPHDNQQPYQVVTYIMCSEGIFPPQS